MKTEDVQIEEIQAGNQAARKKLQGFRSGLQKLMNKKSKKLSHHQPPSHDTKSPINKKQQNYFSNNSVNSPSSNFNFVPPGSAAQFGFNSTLFRQIADDTLIVSNPSGLHKQDTASKFTYNSVPNTQYFSVNSKPSVNFYEPRMQGGTSENFAKASKLFSQVEDIINKSRKTAKLPVKPIQKYFDKIQQNLTVSNVEDLELNLSKSGIRFEEGLKMSPRKEINQNMRLGRSEEIKSQQKDMSASAKDELKNASSFLKNLKGKPDIMKAPPLPPCVSKEQVNKNQRQKQTKGQSREKIYQASEQRQYLMKAALQSVQKHGRRQNSVQIHKNKLKQALGQRKKMMKQDGILDDSIELELSDQDNEHEENVQQINLVDKTKNDDEIRKLQAQREILLNQLQNIQQQLQRLQHY